jgi:pimeloyl-ACP methyl ester carboxylesterase
MRPLADAVGGLSPEALAKGDYAPDLPVPETVWTIDDFADWAAEQIRAHCGGYAYIAGHSFGGKIAVACAARHPDLVAGIFVIAGAAGRTTRGKIFNAIAPIARKFGISGRRFRSADYDASSGTQREILAAHLDYDIFKIAPAVKCRAVMIYGDADTTTPPAIGRRLARTIMNSRFELLHGFNHWTILSVGYWQVAAIIKQEINK